MAGSFSFHKLCLSSPAFENPLCQERVCSALEERCVGEEADGIEAVTMAEGSGVVVYIRACCPYRCERIAAALVCGLYMQAVSTDARQEGLDPEVASILRYGFDVKHERELALSDVEWSALWGRGGRESASVN